MLVDDVAGSMHQVFGSFEDGAYLLDRDGRVAFYQMVAGPKQLQRAIEQLLAQEGRGVVQGGLDRVPHFGSAIKRGWPAIRQGSPRSITDLLLAIPLSPLILWTGYRLARLGRHHPKSRQTA